MCNNREQKKRSFVFKRTLKRSIYAIFLIFSLSAFVYFLICNLLNFYELLFPNFFTHMSKSIDLREAAIAYHESGHTIAETAEIFGVGKSTISGWKRKKKETGNLKDKPLNRTYKKIEPERLKRYVKEHPEATQQEMAEEFGCCNQAISKALKRNKITRKKRRFVTKNRIQKK